ncbi:MAG: hypothetical protein WCG30_00705 [Candidatus Saccharibacteria bacterium]
MPETTMTRNEHSRSLEQGDILRSIETLKDLGLLSPVSQIDIYHGRASESSDSSEWRIDPQFNNSGNSTNNVNERPTLYAGNEQLASEFANRRKEQQESRSEGKDFIARIHQITSDDSDAVILNSGFKLNSLNQEDRASYFEALGRLELDITDGSPVSFDEIDDLPKLRKSLEQFKFNNFISSKEAIGAADDAHVSERLALQICGSLNARKILKGDPLYLALSLLNENMDIFNIDNDESDEPIPINSEYLYRFFRKAHIVGIQHWVLSATVKKPVEIISLFDIEKTATKKQLENRRNNVNQKYGKIALEIDKSNPNKSNPKNNKLLTILGENPHAKPDQLIEAAKQIEGYQEIFEMDTGNWEKFTLAEHTETVLRNFDENYADIIPVELLVPMRLAIIAHDLGKPIASSRNQKHLQKNYNKVQAMEFYSKLGINDKLKNLLVSIIGDGEELVRQMQLTNNSRESVLNMENFALKSLSNFFGTDDISEDQISGFYGMCKMLQICDGGAYTSMGITRNRNNRYYRNAGSFRDSFSDPGYGRRRLIPRTDSNQPAPRDLAPRV